MELKLSCQENLADGKTFSDRCRILSDLGFGAVEIWGRDLLGNPAHVEEYAKILRRFNLAVSVIVVGYRGSLLDPSPAERGSASDDIVELLKIAGTLKAVGLIVVPVFGPPKIPDLSPVATAVELEDKLMIEHLKVLGPHAHSAGTRLILEPLNRGETHYLRTLDHASRLIDAANAPGVALMGDLFHMNIEETGITQALKRNRNKLVHLHLADNTRLEPGTGMTDFSAAFKVLNEIQYPYYVSLECGFSSPDRNGALKKTVEFLRKIKA